MSKHSKKSRSELIWKPAATFWVSLGLLAFGLMALVAFFFASNKKFSDWLTFVFYWFWTGGALVGTIYGLRTRIKVEENGVRWRDWRGVWRAAKWDEISDFSKRISRNETYYTVETPHSDFKFDRLGDGKAIAKRIAERASNAPVFEWEVKGERLTDEWPRRFEFCPLGRNGAAIIALAGLLTTLVAVALLFCFWLPPRQDVALSVWLMAYVGPILMLPLLPLVICCFIWRRSKEAQPFRGQSVAISPAEIVFEGATRLAVSWSHIQAWHWIKRGTTQLLQLQTESGAIEIPVFIAGFKSLCRCLERFGGVPLVQTGEEESMALYPVETAPDGTLIFSFYSATAQVLVWQFLPLGGIMCIVPFLMHIADPQRPVRDAASVFWVGGAAFFGAAAVNWWLHRAKLCLTRDALKWRVPFLPRVVAWQNIGSFGSAPGNSGWISVNGKKISLSLLGCAVAQHSHLHAEIEKRAVNAQGQWQ